jgi:predicted dehydrogenase
MPLRVGLFGTGQWARTRHGVGLAHHPEIELVGVWGRNPERAAETAAAIGTVPYKDVDALIADVDAVSVALPPDVQVALAVKAAEAGRHLFLDKPLALSEEDADAVVAAAEAAGVASVVYFTALFRAELDGWYEASRTGEWTSATVTFLASIFGPGSPTRHSAWRQERGGLWDIGPHALSFVLPALGPISAVSATDGRDGVIHLLSTHTGGATSALTLSISAPPEAMHREATLYGSSGVLDMPKFERDADPAFATALDRFLAAIDGRQDPTTPDVHFGRDVVRVLCAAERARRQPAEPVKIS